MYLAARPSLALRTLHVFIFVLFFFARPTDPPSREGGRWETKHFIGMALDQNLLPTYMPSLDSTLPKFLIFPTLYVYRFASILQESN